MKKLSKKIISLALVAALMTAIMSFCLVVDAANENKVRVIVRNDVFSVSDGAAWDGVLVDEWIDIDEETTMMSAVITALDKHGYTQSGAENNYITELNGLSASDGGYMGGFMGTLNDWFTDQGSGAYTVADGTLESGDEICIMYTVAWGEDIGSLWSNNDTYLTDITFNNGVLNSKFEPSVKDYTLTIPSDTQSINVIPTAFNKNYQVRTYLNDYTPAESGTEYKRSANIPVSDGDKIIVSVGDKCWPSMNASSGADIYTFTIKTKENTDAVDEKINSVSDHFLTLNTPSIGSIGGDFLTIGLARNNTISDEFADGYYSNAVEYVKKIGSSKLDEIRSTENARLILALTSIGKDVTNVGGYNLLEPLSDFDFVIKQGVNGPVWTLIAIDSNDYELPADSKVSEQTTRELLINTILYLQLKDGGWSLYGTKADLDMTGMAIQSLSKYYGKNESVTKAVNKAVNKLSEMQSNDGGFSSWGSANVENCSQIAVALTSIGINPATDKRFIKNGNSLIDCIMSYSVDKGFCHIIGGKYDQMATEQAFYALIAYKRLVSNQTPLYDMTDVFNEPNLSYDVDLNGKVSIDDATLIQKYIVELNELSEEQIMIADCNNDGKVSIDDATFIQKFLVN